MQSGLQLTNKILTYIGTKFKITICDTIRNSQIKNLCSTFSLVGCIPNLVKLILSNTNHSRNLHHPINNNYSEMQFVEDSFCRLVGCINFYCLSSSKDLVQRAGLEPALDHFFRMPPTLRAQTANRMPTCVYQFRHLCMSFPTRLI